MKAARAIKSTRGPIKRFPNSIHACNWLSSCPITGLIEPSTHSGQVGQPSPAPVKRTAPPVTTNPAFTTSKAVKSVERSFMLVAYALEVSSCGSAPSGGFG